MAALLLAALAPAGDARANGDPASHWLLAGNLFYSFHTGISQQALDALRTTLGRSKSAGYPIRVALIEQPADLGDVGSLWGKPTDYAHLLAVELRTRYRGPVLIVMPAGTGFAYERDGTRAERRALMSVHVAPGRDGLAVTAIHAISVLSKRAGHPTVPASIAPSSPASRSESTLLLVILGLAATFLASCVVLVLLYRRQGGRRPSPG